MDIPEKRFRSSKLDRLQSTWTSVSVLRTFPKSGKTGEVTDCSVVMDWLPFSWHVNELDFSAFLSLLRFIWMREELRCLWWFIWFWARWIFTGWEEGARLRALVVEGLNNAGRSTRHRHLLVALKPLHGSCWGEVPRLPPLLSICDPAHARIKSCCFSY